MRKLRWILISAMVAAAVLVDAAPAFAIHPHFNNANVTSVTSNSITVAFKESGLGDSQNSVNIRLSGTAECINGGGKHPKARNKESLSTSGTFNVSNGQASGELTMTADLTCSPPMTIAWTGLKVTDTTFNDSKSIPGTFSSTS